MSTIAQRVAAGAALLDEHAPGWDELIDLNKLQMASCERCICGQVAQAAYAGILRIRTTKRPFGYSSMLRFLERRLKIGRYKIDPAAYGFDTVNSDQSYASLEREWSKLIRRRIRERQAVAA